MDTRRCLRSITLVLAAGVVPLGACGSGSPDGVVESAVESSIRPSTTVRGPTTTRASVTSSTSTSLRTTTTTPSAASNFVGVQRYTDHRGFRWELAVRGSSFRTFVKDLTDQSPGNASLRQSIRSDLGTVSLKNRLTDRAASYDRAFDLLGFYPSEICTPDRLKRSNVSTTTLDGQQYCLFALATARLGGIGKTLPAGGSVETEWKANLIEFGGKEAEIDALRTALNRGPTFVAVGTIAGNQTPYAEYCNPQNGSKTSKYWAVFDRTGAELLCPLFD